MQTVPSIDAVLGRRKDDRKFVARLLLAASDAVGSQFAQDYFGTLRIMAEGKDGLQGCE